VGPRPVRADHCGYEDIGGTTILKLSYVEGFWVSGLNSLRRGLLAGFCSSGDELSG
jgi:hypothetical protein